MPVEFFEGNFASRRQKNRSLVKVLLGSKDIDDDRAFNSLKCAPFHSETLFLNAKLPAIPLHFIVVTKSSNFTMIFFYISINFLKSIRIY